MGTCFDVTVLAWRKYATIYIVHIPRTAFATTNQQEENDRTLTTYCSTQNRERRSSKFIKNGNNETEISERLPYGISEKS
jgi:hypothetical protein